MKDEEEWSHRRAIGRRGWGRSKALPRVTGRGNLFHDLLHKLRFSEEDEEDGREAQALTKVHESAMPVKMRMGAEGLRGWPPLAPSPSPGCRTLGPCRGWAVRGAWRVRIGAGAARGEERGHVAVGERACLDSLHSHHLRQAGGIELAAGAGEHVEESLGVSWVHFGCHRRQDRRPARGRSDTQYFNEPELSVSGTRVLFCSGFSGGI